MASRHDILSVLQDVQSGALTPEDALLRKEAMEELNEALKSLDRLEANILLRKYYYMQSTHQIGAELGLSVRAVEGRLYRIRKKLMKKMGGHDHD